MRIAPGDFAINSALEATLKPGEARFYKYAFVLDFRGDLFIIKGYITPGNEEGASADMQTLSPGYLQPARDRQASSCAVSLFDVSQPKACTGKPGARH